MKLLLVVHLKEKEREREDEPDKMWDREIENNEKIVQDKQ